MNGVFDPLDGIIIKGNNYTFVYKNCLARGLVSIELIGCLLYISRFLYKSIKHYKEVGIHRKSCAVSFSSNTENTNRKFSEQLHLSYLQLYFCYVCAYFCSGYLVIVRTIFICLNNFPR